MKYALGLKILLLLLLAVLLLIPLTMVRGVIFDRMHYRDQVVSDIERTWTGPQHVGGPVLTVLYDVEHTKKNFNKETKKYEYTTSTSQQEHYLLPQTLEVSADVATETRARGIYTVPVFNSAFEITGQFDISELHQLSKTIKGFKRWNQAFISLVVGDVRGIDSQPEMRWNNQAKSFNAGSVIPHLSSGVHASVNTLFDSLKASQNTAVFEIDLKLRGSRELMLIPLGDQTTARMTSTWPHPGFDGLFLPQKHQIDDSGFVANWAMSEFSTSVQQKFTSCLSGDCSAFNQLRFGVQMVETVDVYQKVMRAVKYGALFIALSFITFFLTETLSAVRLHPLHYLLTGSALAMFYLLLMSLSEHVGFGIAYLVAAVASAILIGSYMSGVLRNHRFGLLFGGGIAVLYAMLFTVLRSEDYALLMGSALLFVVLAVVMTMTRHIDWYGVNMPSNSGASGEILASDDAA